MPAGAHGTVRGAARIVEGLASEEPIVTIPSEFPIVASIAVIGGLPAYLRDWLARSHLLPWGRGVFNFA